MVWYNITAYNIKVKFVLRNNKEKVICNNKNAEGVMHMIRKRNLERAIILYFLVSSITVTALAQDISSTEINSAGEGYSIKGEISDVDNININITKGGTGLFDTTAGLSVWDVILKTTGNGDIFIFDTTNEAGNNTALDVSHGGEAYITGKNVYIVALNGLLSSLLPDDAVAATNDGYVEITGDTVQIIGNMDLTDNTGNEANQIKVTFSSNNSFWYGDERNDSNDKGILDVTLSNGAEWIYNRTNDISALTLNDGGIVNLQDKDIEQKYEACDISEYRSLTEHKSVTIKTLKGTGGIFKVDLDWDVNQGRNYGNSSYYLKSGSDYIYIEKVDGTDSKQIVDFDASKAHLENMEINKDKLYFANVENGTTSFITASSVYSNAGNVFDYTYGTGSDNGKDWYIAVSGKSAESNPNFSAAKGAMYAGYALGTELDTLNKRMGEARYLEEDDGVWVRYRHSKTGWDDTYETNGDMFQLGFDNEVTEKDGKHYRGVAIDYTDADTNIMGISGEGEHERYAVSLYDTWLGEKGHYRDLVLRGGRINSDYDISGAFSSGYEDIGGDYHQWFGSISAEWGRKNDIGTGWYFEPQVQAQLARIGGASYVSDSGVDVDQDGATSLIGRAGFRIGREYVKDNGKHDNFYIKADLLHEFAGDKSFSLTGNDGRYDKEYDGQETWCDIGIGADISLGKNSYFWADVERTFGADFDNTWQINGGFRWEF